MKLRFLATTIALLLTHFALPAQNGGQQLAQVFDARINLARLFYESGDFDQAIKIYTGLADEPLAPWQHAVIVYDLATAELARQEAQNALNYFQSIPLENLNFPLLTFRLTHNMGLAELLLAKQKAESMKRQKVLPIDVYRAVIPLFQQAIRTIDKAKERGCRLVEAEGGEVCEVPLEVKEALIEAKVEYAKELQALRQFMQESVSMQEGGVILLVSALTAIQQNDWLNNYRPGAPYLKEYLRMYRQQDISWLPVWKRVEDLAAKAEHKQMKDLFHDAYEAYSSGIEEMEKGDYDKSRHAFNISKNDLIDFVNLLFSNRTMKEQFENLRLLYTFTLLQEPIRPAFLEAIKLVQAQLKPLVEAKEIHKFKPYFELAEHYLNEGKIALKQHQQIFSRMYVEEARFQVDQILEQRPLLKIEDAKTILKQMVQAGEMALLLNHLREKVSMDDTQVAPLDDLVYRAEKRVLEPEKEFYQAVVKEQEAKPVETPWEEVIPVFAEGAAMAKQAEKLLIKPEKNSRQIALSLQEKTVSKWKEAIALMQKIRQSDIKQKESRPLKKEGGAKIEKPEKEKEGKESINQVLRLLQEMENDDRSQPHLLETPVKKNVKRPW